MPEIQTISGSTSEPQIQGAQVPEIESAKASSTNQKREPVTVDARSGAATSAVDSLANFFTRAVGSIFTSAKTNSTEL